MKKIVALMLALAMALSAFAAAEPAKNAPPADIVLSSSIRVERGVAGALMDALGIDEETRGVIDSALALLNTVNDQLTIASNGIEYRISMHDAELLSVKGGITDDGFVLLSSLIPNYALTLSGGALGAITKVYGLVRDISLRFRVERSFVFRNALKALTTYIQSFIDETISTMKLGEPEKGVFEFGEGVSYNTRQSVGVDTQFIDAALSGVISNLVRNKKAAFVLDKLGVSVQDIRKVPFVGKRLPVLDMVLYSNTDDRGARISTDRCYAFALTLAGQSAPCATFDLHLRESSIAAALDIPGRGENGGIAAAFSYAPFDPEAVVGGMALSVEAMGGYYSVSGVIAPNADDTARVFSDAIYIMDATKPLAAATTTVEALDAPLDLSIGKREAIPIPSLFGKKGKEVRQKLRRSMMFSGVRMLATAAKAAPEAAGLLSLLTGDKKDAA